MGGEADEMSSKSCYSTKQCVSGREKSQERRPQLAKGKGTLVAGDGLERRTDNGS